MCLSARWEAAQPAYQRSLWVLESVQRRLRTPLALAGSGAGDGCTAADVPSSEQLGKRDAVGTGDVCQSSLPARPAGAPAAGDNSAALGSAQPSADSKPSTAAASGNGAGPEGGGGSAGSAGLPGPAVRSMLLCGADVVASFGAPGVWREDLLRGILSNHGVVCIARCLTRPTRCLQLGQMICAKFASVQSGMFSCQNLLFMCTSKAQAQASWRRFNFLRCYGCEARVMHASRTTCATHEPPES